MNKKSIFNFIRSIHLKFFLKDFPDNIAIYFHNVESNRFNDFIDILKFFNDLNYKIVDPSSYVKKDNKKKLFISFDDNYYNWIKISELLAKNDFKATFYTNSGAFSDIATKKYLNDYFNRIKYNKDLRTISKNHLITIYKDHNNIIGGHTVNHFNLNGIKYQNAINEIYENKIHLEQIINHPIYHFSYPFGMRRYFNENLRNYCKEINYKTVCNAIPGQLFNKKDNYDIYRTMWDFNIDFMSNLDNIKVDGRLFHNLFQKSPIG